MITKYRNYSGIDQRRCRHLVALTRQCGLLAAMLYLSLAVKTHAADRFWSSQTGGTFSVAANWQNGVAGPNDIARFGVSSIGANDRWTYTVFFNADAQNQALMIEDDNVTFDLAGRAYTTTLNPSIFIGMVGPIVNITSTGRLTIKNGTVRTAANADLPVGAVVGSPGFLTITTGGMLFSGAAGGTGTWYIGAVATGTFTVENAGIAEAQRTIVGDAANITGTANVTGFNSFWNNLQSLVVGDAGKGKLNVTSAGLVGCKDCVVAQEAQSTGDVVVSGGFPGFSSQWRNRGSLIVGGRGQGSMMISAGGSVTNTLGVIGSHSTGSGMVTVDGVRSDDSPSQWINAGVLTVGQGGSGIMSITNGGLVQSAEGEVGMAAKGVVIVDGTGSRWTSLGRLTVGLNNRGELHITRGGKVFSTSGSFDYVGDEEGGIGSVTVEGHGSEWISTGVVKIGGEDGVGTLAITGGGRVQVEREVWIADAVGKTAEVVVDGAGSEWICNRQMSVGNRGAGTMVIRNGGRVASRKSYLGLNGGADGFVTVEGENSQWTADTVDVYGVSSILQIRDGGVISDRQAGVGRFGNSTANVSGRNTRWLNSGGMLVGGAGNGVLNVSGGARIESVTSIIGGAPQGTGTATLAGADAFDTATQWINHDNMTVGDGGTGSLLINAPALVRVGGELAIGDLGVVNLSGGTLDADILSFPNGTRFAWTGGTLHARIVNGDLANQGGVLAPGHSTGVTTINGDYTQNSSGVLEIEIGGTAIGTQLDFVAVNGKIALGGELRLKLINQFLPTSGQAFAVVGSITLQGAFANVATGQRLNVANGGGSFVVHYGAGSAFDPSQVQLTDFASAPTPTPTPTPGCFTWGDMNGDGIAGAVDAAQILQFDVFLLDCFPIDANCDGRGPEDKPECAR